MQIRTIGLVGLGLMGRGIAACLLSHGFKVVSYERDEKLRSEAGKHIALAMREMVERGLAEAVIETTWQKQLIYAGKISDLRDCDFVIESIIEDVGIKQHVYDELEAAVKTHVPIASNTSAIPISSMQIQRKHPARFVGMHWAEPANATRFMEIIRGDKTDDGTFAAAEKLAFSLGKEPSMVKKDIRGFVTNRLMYAVLREALHLLDEGVADVETIDRSFRNDMGMWATIAGPFRWMDLTGIPAYAAVAKDLFPELSNAKTVSPSLVKLAESGALGVRNGKGFYHYTPQEAEHWEEVWRQFTWDLVPLANKYVPVKPPKS